MMISKKYFLFNFIFLILFSSLSVRADDYSYIYLGGGVGNFAFSKVDDTRENPEGLNDQDYVVRQVQLRRQYFMEWYFLENVGISYRHTYLWWKRNTGNNTFLPSTLEQRWEIFNDFITFNFWLYKSGSHQFGALLGGGKTEYLYFESFDQPSISTRSYTRTYLSYGRNETYGLYWDWGGADFGMRLGVSQINTYLPKIEVRRSNLTTERLEIDASGVASYIEFRWAIQ